MDKYNFSEMKFVPIEGSEFLRMTSEDPDGDRLASDQINAEEAAMEIKLEKYLKRIVELRKYMWT